MRRGDGEETILGRTLLGQERSPRTLSQELHVFATWRSVDVLRKVAEPDVSYRFAITNINS